MWKFSSTSIDGLCRGKCWKMEDGAFVKVAALDRVCTIFYGMVVLVIFLCFYLKFEHSILMMALGLEDLVCVSHFLYAYKQIECCGAHLNGF